jgi:hypothetical protein
LGSFHSPKISLASALETEPATMTSWPCTQFTGVATLWPSIAASRLREDLIELAAGGHWVDEDELDLAVRADDEHVSYRLVVGRGPLRRIAGGSGALRFLDVVGPALLLVDWVDNLTPRRSNSGFIFAMYPSAVVQTGVKSLG